MTTTVQFLSQWGPHHPGPHGPMGPVHGGSASGVWGAFGPFPWLALLVLLAVFAIGVYLIVHVAREHADAGEPADAALVTLRERFARGEIGAEEFERSRDRLVG